MECHMTHNVETDQPTTKLPTPGKTLTWATGPAVLAIALTAWLMLRTPPAPYRVPVATVCVVAAGTTGFLLLAALVLLIARYFTERFDRLEHQQEEMKDYMIAQGAQIEKVNDRAQQTCRNTKRISQGLEDLRGAYIEEGIPTHRRAA